MPKAEYKRCKDCGEEKLITEEFYPHRNMRSGTLNKCKDCLRKRCRERRLEKLEERRQKEKKYREENPDVLKAWKRANPERIKKYHQDHAARHPQKARARKIVLAAVQEGRLVKPEACEDCGRVVEKAAEMHGHHGDYTKPYDVEWLCYQCHRARHESRDRISQ